jgi:tRNA1(Val) A37 N6-methylase TrmN6
MFSAAAGETLDPFYRGRFKLLQPERGYRFSTDAPLLAAFVEVRPGDEVCELGTGNGLVAVLLSVRPFKNLTAVEIQPRLAGLARRNVAGNGLSERIEVVEADLRTWRPGKRFDVVLSNPPYRARKGGYPCPDPEKAVAKHEVTCDILSVMSAVSGLLKDDGRAYFIYPATREADLREAARTNRMSPRRIRYIVPREGDPANHFLAEIAFVSASPGAGLELPPLVLHDAAGAFTAEAQALLDGPKDDPAR